MKIRSRIIASLIAVGVTSGLGIANAESSSALSSRWIENSPRSAGVLYGSCNAANPWPTARILKPGQQMGCGGAAAYTAPPGFIANWGSYNDPGGKWRVFGVHWYNTSGALVTVRRA